MAITQTFTSKSTKQMALDTASELASAFDDSREAEFSAELEKTLPGYKNILSQISSNVQSMLRGELPGDVQQQVSQMAAEKNLKGGRYGEIGRNLVARDLGKTSLEVEQMGEMSALKLLDMVSTKLTPPPTDLADLYKAGLQSDLQKSSLSITAAANQAQQQMQSQQLSWEKELSQWNRNFEMYAIKQQQAQQAQTRSDIESYMQKQASDMVTKASVYGQARSQYFSDAGGEMSGDSFSTGWDKHMANW